MTDSTNPTFYEAVNIKRFIKNRAYGMKNRNQSVEQANYQDSPVLNTGLACKNIHSGTIYHISSYLLVTTLLNLSPIQ